MQKKLLSSTVFSLVLLSGALAFASSPQGSFEKTFPVSGPVELEVQSHSGDILVRSGGAGSVTIVGKIFIGGRWLRGNREADVSDIEQHPPLRQDGNRIHVDYVNAHNISVNYEITVPADTAVITRSGSGDQIIEGTHGNAELQSGSGNITLNHLTGEIRLQTGSGDVRAREIAGPVRGEAGSGNIELEEMAVGDVNLHTGSGNITARGVRGGLRAETGSGDIRADGAPTETWEIRTGSGNLRVHLPPDAAFDADISTSSGTLSVDAPITMTIQGRVNDIHKSIHGKVRGGGPLLNVHTGSGDIHID